MGMMEQAEAELRQAEADVERTGADAERAVAAHTAAQGHAAELRTVYEWFKRHSQPRTDVASSQSQQQSRQPEMALSTPRFGNPAPGATQADLCYRVIEESATPIMTTEVRKTLERQGYSFTQMQVRSAIKYLARKGKIVGGNGTWQLPRADVPPPLLSPAAATAAATMNGAGGSP